MDRINSSNARPDVNGTGKKGFHDNADLSGQDATYVTPDFLNFIQEEICSIIEKNGHVLDPNSKQQLFDILATEESILALAEAIEQRISALTVIMATKTALQQAIDYASANLKQHKDAKNPHPQYLLATTFGVDLPMTAVESTPIVDANRIYGWNGESGDTGFSIGGVRWWNSRSGTFTFKPWRAYGKFLLWFDFQPQGDGNIYVKTFSKEGLMISDVHVSEIHSTNQQEPVKYVFELPQGGYAEIVYNLSVWNRSYGDGHGSIYVDDRPKSFHPVGYTSTVDYSNDAGVTDEQQDDGYESYPNFEWFYYSDALKQYIELSAISTFSQPVSKVPYYHRSKFTDHLNSDLWVVIEVGKQAVELPSPDYVALQTQTVPGAVDANGDIVCGIPFSMRSIDTANNETLVYSIAYYETAVVHVLSEPFPDNSINGKKSIYVRP